jgi:hypothetical protein
MRRREPAFVRDLSERDSSMRDSWQTKRPRIRSDPDGRSRGGGAERTRNNPEVSHPIARPRHTGLRRSRD